jgi:hypothetical protein
MTREKKSDEIASCRKSTEETDMLHTSPLHLLSARHGILGPWFHGNLGHLSSRTFVRDASAQRPDGGSPVSARKPRCDPPTQTPRPTPTAPERWLVHSRISLCDSRIRLRHRKAPHTSIAPQCPTSFGQRRVSSGSTFLALSYARMHRCSCPAARLHAAGPRTPLSSSAPARPGGS